MTDLGFGSSSVEAAKIEHEQRKKALAERIADIGLRSPSLEHVSEEMFNEIYVSRRGEGLAASQLQFVEEQVAVEQAAFARAIQEEAAQRSALIKKATVVVLLVAIVITVVVVVFGEVGRNSATRTGTRKNAAESDSESGDEFTLCESYLRDLCDMLGCGDFSAGWDGGAAKDHEAHLLMLKDAVRHMADVNLDVQDTVQTQAKQVHARRTTLGDTLQGLMAAVPVAEALYGAGPAGPALSYSFQLATAHAAVGVDVDTTKDMHADAEKNGERLSGLIGEYEELFLALPDAEGSR